MLVEMSDRAMHNLEPLRSSGIDSQTTVDYGSG